MSYKLPTQLDHYRLLGRSGLRVSPLCLGCATFGTEWGWGCDKQTSKTIFDIYVERGGNHFNTSNFYTDGTSERLLGEFMGSERDRFVLETKYTNATRWGDPNSAGNHRKSMMQAIEGSLRRLKTDYIDIYKLHVWDFATPIDELMRGLDDLVRSGKVNYIAASNIPAWKIAQCNTYAEAHALTRFISMEVEYSLIERSVERELLPMGCELGVAVQPYSALGAGVLTAKYMHSDIQDKASDGSDSERKYRPLKLTERNLQIADVVKQIANNKGRTPAQVALNWLLAREGVPNIIIGARTSEQLEDNLDCLKFKLPDEHLNMLDEVSKIGLGYPHEFVSSEMVLNLLTARSTTEPFL